MEASNSFTLHVRYFLPVAAWLQRHPNMPIALRACGPTQPWLDLLAKSVDLQILPPGPAPHMLACNRMAQKTLRGYDFPGDFNKKRIHRGVTAIRQFLEAPPIEGTVRDCRVIIVDRRSSEDFYHSGASDGNMSGSEHQSTPHLGALSHIVIENATLTIIDLATVPPLNQISLMSRIDIFVAQHGVTLLPMVWMPEHSPERRSRTRRH